jgi:TatD DNase family protein
LYIAQTLALWKNMAPEKLAQIAAQNGKRLFGIEV